MLCVLQPRSRSVRKTLYVWLTPTRSQFTAVCYLLVPIVEAVPNVTIQLRSAATFQQSLVTGKGFFKCNRNKKKSETKICVCWKKRGTATIVQLLMPQ